MKAQSAIYVEMDNLKKEIMSLMDIKPNYLQKKVETGVSKILDDWASKNIMRQTIENDITKTEYDNLTNAFNKNCFKSVLSIPEGMDSLGLPYYDNYYPDQKMESCGASNKDELIKMGFQFYVLNFGKEWQDKNGYTGDINDK